ncbi:fibronectin type III domain-containing protein [Candidatus Uhrbacteria bacterium]|nr:fibronectin type III domain-containing protein [Candidatus Uhrbacteria bacterium]
MSMRNTLSTFHVRDIPFVAALLAVALSLPLMILDARAQAEPAPIITSGPTAAAASLAECPIDVRWQTNVESTSVVEFGTTTSLERDPARTIDPMTGERPYEEIHAVSLCELKKGTTYYYRVRSANPSGAEVVSAMATFKTAGVVFEGTPLDGVVVTSPAAAASLKAPVTVTASIEGSAQSVAFTVSDSKGAAIKTAAGTADASGTWGAIFDGLTADGYTVAATAKGYDAEGATISKTSAKVNFVVVAPELKPTPEPTKEPEPTIEPEKKLEPTPKPTAEPEKREPEATEPEKTPTAEPTSKTTAAEPEKPNVPEEEPQSPAFVDLRKSLESLERNTADSLIAPPSPGAQALTANDLCVQNGILPERCKSWLEVRFADKTCAEAGLTTRESCEKFLTSANNGVFPGCEGKNEAECATVKNLTTISYLPAEVKEKANAAIQELINEKKVADLPGLMPIAKTELAGVGWWKSSPAAGAETSPGVLVKDSDGDKLFDDFESLMGTDPTKADSDGDGVNDTDELKNGSNPAGTGKLAKALTPTESAVVFRKPIEQPRGSGKVNPAFKVETSAPTTGASDEKKGKTGTIKGRCAPKATCLLYVYSYIPMVFTAAADENGDFTYTLDQSLIDGEHTVYVALTDDTGKITAKSNPLSFFIKEAQAASKDDFLRADVNVSQEPAAQMSRTYLWASLLLIPIAAMLVWQVAKKRKTA